jgi:hypothetical protein
MAGQIVRFHGHLPTITRRKTAPMSDLPFRYRFAADELAAIKECHDTHGFVLVADMLDERTHQSLCQDVRRRLIPEGTLPGGQGNIYQTTFVEHSPTLLSLLDDRRFMAVAETLGGTTELAVHRSAAIVRQPGDNGMTWHSDYCWPVQWPPKSASQHLNHRREGVSLWFYLTGSNPENGGVALMPNSHRPDWPGPDGFDLTADRHSFHRRGTPARGYLGMDIPGVLPIRSQPRDLVIFDIVTYHGVFPHTGNETRLSAALVFRPDRQPFAAPWPLTEQAKAFLATVPAHLRPYLKTYVGLDRDWKPETT